MTCSIRERIKNKRNFLERLSLLRRISLLVFGLVLALCIPQLDAATIYLKSGRKVEGQIVSRDKETVKVKLALAGEEMELVFFTDEIERIEEDREVSSRQEGSKETGKKKDIRLTSERDRSLGELFIGLCLLRGVIPKYYPPYEKVDEKEMQRYLKERLERLWGRSRIVSQEALLKYLGLVDANFDYGKYLEALLGAKSEVVYDPYRGMLLFTKASSLGNSPQDTPELIEEMTKAVLSNIINIASLDSLAHENTDLYLARETLLCGDTVVLEMDYSLHWAGKDLYHYGIVPKTLKEALSEKLQAAKLDTAPDFLKEIYFFPYLEGSRLVEAVYRDKGWEGVNNLCQNPPSSTEQIMDFASPSSTEKTPSVEKTSEARKEPVKIYIRSLDVALGPDFQRVEADVWGRLRLYLYLKNCLQDEMTAKVAAQGWGGDRIELFRYKDGKMSLAWISSWDTPQDAQEFFRTIGACVNKRFPQMRLLTQKNEVLAWEDGNTQIYAEKKGQEVLILENIPRHLLEKIKAHSWQNVFP